MILVALLATLCFARAFWLLVQIREDRRALARMPRRA
jgi:hypothetical protein